MSVTVIIWWGNIFEIPGKLCRCIQIYNRVTIIIIRTSSPSNGYQIDNRSKAFKAEMKKSNRTWGLNPWKDCSQFCLHMCMLHQANSLPPHRSSLPGSSVCGIFQTRILEWVAISYSRESSRPKDQTPVSCIGRWLLYHWATWETPNLVFTVLLLKHYITKEHFPLLL